MSSRSPDAASGLIVQRSLGAAIASTPASKTREHRGAANGPDVADTQNHEHWPGTVSRPSVSTSTLSALVRSPVE
jgi:hypothetical protein